MKVLKYATGEEIPKGAKYLHTIKNGKLAIGGRELVWHYFLVDDTKKRGSAN